MESIPLPWSATLIAIRISAFAIACTQRERHRYLYSLIQILLICALSNHLP
jgi:hypothetical protein